MAGSSAEMSMHDRQTDPNALRWVDLDGVRTRRVISFFIDFAIICALVSVAAIVVFFLGILTFGLGFALYAILVPAVALLYCAATIGSREGATWGMRLTDLKLVRKDGSPPDIVYGGMHAILFYLSVAILTPFVILFSLVNGEKRLLHDMLLGGVVIRGRD